MRAALYYGKEDIRLEDVPEPTVGPGDVKLRVLYSGICGSDLQEYYAGPRRFRVETPHPLTGISVPAIIGHELCGEVVEVGAGVEGLGEGDLVSVEPTETCGRCGPCLKGRGKCKQAAVHGYNRASGGFAEYSVIKQKMVHRLPAAVDAFSGALVEPMAVGMISATSADVSAGDTVALHGAGPIGIGALLALRAFGVEVIVSEPSARRREAVRALGVAHVLDPSEVDVGATVRELTDDDGAAASIDCAGVAAVLDAAIASTAPDGRVVLTANHLQPITLDPPRFKASRVLLMSHTGKIRTGEAFERVIELMEQGHYPTGGWTETIPFDNLIDEGFEPLRRQEKVKVVVDMSAR
jgi:(R,R)-butanediol dehydrogenase/meso-butanediol dehydrogenase/diacetyl reductase